MINHAVRLANLRAVNGFDRFSWHSSDNRMRWHVFCDHRARRDHRALSYPHTICDDRAGTKPDVIFDHNPFRRDSLLYKRTIRVVEDMIDRDDLRERRGIDAVADLHPALPADHGIFSNEAISPDLDSRMRQVPKIIDMQNRAMHHNGPGTELDPAGTGMKIDSFIQINAMTEFYVICKPQADVALDRDGTVHV